MFRCYDRSIYSFLDLFLYSFHVRSIYSCVSTLYQPISIHDAVHENGEVLAFLYDTGSNSWLGFIDEYDFFCEFYIVLSLSDEARSIIRSILFHTCCVTSTCEFHIRDIHFLSLSTQSKKIHIELFRRTSGGKWFMMLGKETLMRGFAVVLYHLVISE